MAGVVEAAGLREAVDEVAVALVGGDATGGRVRLREEPLLLEHGHLVAHRGRRDVHPGRVDHMARADGLRCFDVLLHDGKENGCLAFVHFVASTWRFTWRSPVRLASGSVAAW